jgi:type VI secretion system secreted protein Hcp
MPFDSFIDLEGIPGEATAKGFEKKIAIQSFSWGASAPVTGEHIPTMTVSIRKQTGAGGQDVFLVYKFEEVMIESVQWSGSSGGDDTPSESVSFAFGKVTLEYKMQGKDGKLVAGTPVVFDLTTLVAE